MKTSEPTKKNKLFLHQFESVLPAVCLEQEQAAQTLSQILVKNALTDKTAADRWVSKFGVKPGLIEKRWFESLELAGNSRDINEKARFFLDRTLEVFRKWYPDAQSSHPDHLVHVTCTGYYAPSSAQRIVNERKWNTETEITHAYHMGCYASIPSIRIAEGVAHARLAHSPDQAVTIDIAHNELCGLHTNPADLSAEQIVVQTLFADGHIKYTLQDERTARLTSKRAFELVAHQEWQIEDSFDDMSWAPAQWGMKMSLQRAVPEKIGQSLMSFLESLAKKAGYSIETLLKEALFAVHPGGPKIIDRVRDLLELKDSALEASVKVLRERGNMSSATLPHIWKNILDNEHNQNQLVVSLAFGPGLTIFGSVFRLQQF